MIHAILHIFEPFQKKSIKERALGGNTIFKIITAYILLVLLPISGVMYFYYRQSVSIAMEQVVQAKYQSLSQTAAHISSRLEAVQEVSNTIFADKILNSLIVTPADDQSVSAVVDEYEHILNILDNHQQNGDIYRIRLFLSQEKSYLNENVNFFPYSGLSTLPWFSSILEKNGAVYWKSTYMQHYSAMTEKIPVISCARLLKNLNRYDEIVGGILIDIQEQDLYAMLGNGDTPDKEKLLIVDTEGMIVSHSDKSRLGTLFQPAGTAADAAALTDGIHTYQNQYLICAAIPAAGWLVVSEISADDIFAEGRTYKNFLDVIVMLGVFILFFTVFLATFWYLVLRMNRRIKHIIKKMETEGIESLDNGPLTSSQELRQLEVGIDYLTQNMKNLMNEAYQVRIEKKETELRLLQAQINPHFLYNTLDSINWMAIRAHADEVGRMIQLLSSYFRLSLNYGKDIISIKDEIYLTSVYLDIQNNRFSNGIAVTFDVDESTLSYDIPKLSLQPIIENAILHGLQNKDDDDWRICVQVKQAGTHIYLTVKDNGVGMPPEVVAQLLQKNPDGIPQRGYGLYNVDRRIKLFFGADCGLSVVSQPNAGTAVTIHIKAIRHSK